MTLPKASSTRQFEPSSSLPSNRPLLPPQPCAACGAELDPLRAPCALAFEDGVRLLCSEECKSSHRSGERVRKKPTPVAAPAAAVSGARRSGPHTPASVPLATIEPRAPSAGATAMWVWIGAATIGTAAMLAGFGGPEMAFAAALLTCLSALATLQLTAPTRRDVSVLGWLLGPLGVMAAALATYADTRHEPIGVDSFGAILTALALLARGVLDAYARGPTDDILQALRRALPDQVHVPLRDPGDGELETEPLDVGKLRVGEEIVTRRGERLGVDGVVQAGAASVRPYPGAGHAIPRNVGDAVLAGARVTEGQLRVLATRVADDRLLMRVARTGDPEQRAAARTLRLMQRALPWIALLVALGAAALLIAGRVRGLHLPLAAASSLLIAAPLLAARRAAGWPLLGAATAAAARGVLFQSGSALDLAGHVRTVAMTPHRTLTEGKPEVLDMMLLSDDAPSPLLALAAGAELLAGDHPIGRAIVSFADKRGVAPSDMRRAAAVTGRGLTGTGPDGEDIVIGSRRLLLDQGVSVAAADAYAARAEAAGRTAVFMAVAGRVRAVFALQDHLRPGARAAVQRLFDLGLEVVLLTGDQRGPVEQLAAGFDIAHIKCELLPEERADEVRSLRDAAGPVAVIGYPSDDAPALAAADVAIMLGAAGSGSADNAITLLSEDLRDAAGALWIARAARSSVLGALRLATVVFLAVATGAALGVVKLGLTAAATLLVDGHGIAAGRRLSRRIALRFGSSS